MTVVRPLIAVALVVALAALAAAANLFLLRLTQDSSDPVGRLSPQATFPAAPTTVGRTTPAVTTTTPRSSDHRHGADD
jgi:hypothetical protein